MGRLFLIDLEGQRRFVCDCCSTQGNIIPIQELIRNSHIPSETHIALFDDILTWSQIGGTNARPGVFLQKVVNVIVDEGTDVKSVNDRPTLVSNVYCTKCRDLLGWKVIRHEALSHGYETEIFLLDRTKLLVYNGMQATGLHEEEEQTL